MQNWVYNDRAGLQLTVLQPRARQGFRFVSRWLTPDLLRLLLRVSASRELSGLSEAELLLLHELGLALPPEELPEFVYFAPRLELSGAPLPPQVLMPSGDERPLKLMPPAAPDSDWPEGLLPAGDVLWLPPARPQELSLPFCPAPEVSALLAGLREKRLALETLPPEQRQLLRIVGVLQEASHGASDRVAAERPSADDLRRQGHITLRGLLNPLHQAALRAYARDLSRCGYFQLDQNQVTDRLLIHNQILLQFLHAQLAQRVAALVGEPLKPSYSVMALYPGGTELVPHQDRRQCLWNLSLVLAYEPSPSELWPFCLQHQGVVHEVRLAIGDAVLYSGSETLHWRPRLPEGRYAAIGLFHFVAADFNESLH